MPGFHWTIGDYVAALILIGGTVAAYSVATKITQNRRYRIVVGIGLVAVLVLVWVELAVGIFD